MRRREFVGGAVAWPVAARAHPTERMRRIGVLVGLAENDPEMKQRLAGFREGLEKLGWSERGNSSSLTALKPWRRCLLHQPPHSIGRSMQDSPTRGQVILVLLLGVLWGLNWPTVKIALAEIGPWTLRASALSLASLALVAITLIRGGTLRIRRAHWWRIALPAVLAISAPNVLIAYAQLSAPTGRIAVVAFTMPVWAIIFARLVLGEPLDQRRLLGLAFGIAGLLALAWPLVLRGELSLGLLLALAAAFCWAAGTVLLKRFPSEAAPLAFATWQLLIGAACVMVGMLLFEGLPTIRALDRSTLIAFSYHAFLGQALATALWFEVVTKIPAGTAALGTLIVPAVGVASAMLLLGEKPALADYVGLALIMAAASTVLLPRGKLT